MEKQQHGGLVVSTVDSQQERSSSNPRPLVKHQEGPGFDASCDFPPQSKDMQVNW